MGYLIRVSQAAV